MSMSSTMRKSHQSLKDCVCRRTNPHKGTCSVGTTFNDTVTCLKKGMRKILEADPQSCFLPQMPQLTGDFPMCRSYRQSRHVYWSLINEISRLTYSDLCLLPCDYESLEVLQRSSPLYYSSKSTPLVVLIAYSLIVPYLQES